MADEMNSTVIDPLDFTRVSEDKFYKVVDLADFKDNDAEEIFQALKNEICLIPFCDYLKRYIFIKSGMSGDFREIDIRDYQRVIIDSFNENNTPKSFKENLTKLSALTKNWLTQNSVSRDTVFLLGFGLNMSVDDVSIFLKNALRERDFNFKDPVEVIYWYCLKKGFKFPKMQQLKKLYDNLSPEHSVSVYDDRTIGVRDSVKNIDDDQALLNYISVYRTENQKCSFSVTSYQWFESLYLKSRSIIADYYNNDETERLEITKIRTAKKAWAADDITEGDVEKIICCGMPMDKSGNLLKFSASKFSKHFDNKRLSRQHISDVINKNTAVSRFDLITLNFFIFSQDDRFGNNKSRYTAFVNNTNAILNECAMGELYVANPYECLVLMCVLSDGPLATYADVWEKSFE